MILAHLSEHYKSLLTQCQVLENMSERGQPAGRFFEGKLSHTKFFWLHLSATEFRRQQVSLRQAKSIFLPNLMMFWEKSVFVGRNKKLRERSHLPSAAVLNYCAAKKLLKVSESPLNRKSTWRGWSYPDTDRGFNFTCSKFQKNRIWRQRFCDYAKSWKFWGHSVF